jgi:hypothetical protein
MPRTCRNNEYAAIWVWVGLSITAWVDLLLSENIAGFEDIRGQKKGVISCSWMLILLEDSMQSFLPIKATCQLAWIKPVRYEHAQLAAVAAITFQQRGSGQLLSQLNRIDFPRCFVTVALKNALQHPGFSHPPFD